MKSQHRKKSFLVNITGKLFWGSCDFNFNFLKIFSKMRQTLYTLPVILSYMKFFVASRFFFFNCWKVKYLRHLNHFKSIFSVKLPLVYIYKFYQKESKIQQPEESWEHLGEVRQGTLKFKVNVRNHRIFWVNLP